MVWQLISKLSSEPPTSFVKRNFPVLRPINTNDTPHRSPPSQASSSSVLLRSPFLSYNLWCSIWICRYESHDPCPDYAAQLITIALKPILISEGIYHSYCTPKEIESGVRICVGQELRLNLMFTIAAVAANVRCARFCHLTEIG